MARRKQVIDDPLAAQVLKDMAALQELLQRFDQYEACGQDCSEFRALANETYDYLDRINTHVIKGQPLPKQPA